MRLQISYMSKIWYILVLAMLSLMVKFADGNVVHARSNAPNASRANHTVEKGSDIEHSFYQLVSIIGEQNDETKPDLGVSLSTVGFRVLFENYGAGKITQKAGASSFILFEADSSPPYQA